MEQSSENIERVIEKLREKVPRRKCAANQFAAKVREHYLEIRDMRKEGYSYLQILSAFEEEKLLPEDSKVNSFKQAFRREFIRRERVNIRTGLPVGISAAPKIKEPEKPAPIAPAYKTDTGRVVHTGTGTIVKRPDGGFDF